MTNKLAAIVLTLCVGLFLLPITWAADVNSQDSDSDGMSDAFEQLGNLNPADPTDSLTDPDGDGLLNVVECKKNTDPSSPDTDRDGWIDSEDDAPVSRAFLQFGALNYTLGDFYEYFHPSWLGLVFKNGGEWGFDESCGLPAWQVDASEKPGVGSLNVIVDRSLLASNLMYALHYYDHTNSTLYLDLMDLKGRVVVKDLYGNLLTGAQEHATNWFEIPLSIFSNAATIHLRRGEGTVTVYEGSLYIDADADGLDMEQERQLGSSDANKDSNGNGINDFDEVFIYNANPAATNSAGPAGTNGPVPSRPPPRPKPPRKITVIFVDRHVGNDTFTGASPVVDLSAMESATKGGGAEPVSCDGPKKTIARGIAAAEAEGADTMIIKPGTYNENLNLHGKTLKVRIQGDVRL